MNAQPPGAPVLTPGRVWALFGLLCVAGIFNAMDRPIIAILKPEMSRDLGWSDVEFGLLGSVTQFVAALSFLFTGWLIDRIGVKRSMVLGVTAWSLAAMAHGWAVTAWQVVAARVGLGATEAIQTPLTIKTVATLFPADRRSFAIGLGTLIAASGAIALPFLIPALTAAFTWRGALLFAGIGGFVTLAIWWMLARGIVFDDGAEDPQLDFADDDAPYGPVLREGRTWAIVIAKALSDSTWWLLNFWLPDFYRREYGLDTAGLALPIAIAFAGSGLGAFAAGWLSTRLLEKGWAVNGVRKTVMLGSALIVLPVPVVLMLGDLWTVAIMMGLVLAGHQGFSLSLFSIITDIVPRSKVGRVTALGACFGNLGGAAIVAIAGFVLAAGLGYMPLLVWAAVSYLLALAWLHIFIPVIERHVPPRDRLAAAFR